VIGPLVETCRVYGNEMPICLESMVLGIAERLGLPGFGRDAFGPGLDLTWPEELHLRAAANLAAGERPDGSGAVPDASDAELEVFLHARAHLPPSVYDPARWERIVGPEWWRKVVYVLNRGGRFDDYEAGYNGPRLRNAYGTLINLYQEKTAKLRHSMTGEPLPGVAVYLPGPFDALGRPIQDERDGYDLHLITYREMAMTKSRTASNYWLLGLMPENHLLLNKRDADRLGLQTGDQVRLTSATNPAGVWDLKNGQTVPMTGRVRVIQGIRPGVVAFSLGHGHWAYGSRDVTIDGQVIAADRRRSTGFHGNAAMRVDPVTQNTTLSDLFGGSAVFYDTKVKLVRA
jgi:anaerobic selenocysteine-containing dehydrogenase